MMSMLKRFLREEEGLEMLEWAVVAVLFVVAGAATWLTLGTQISTTLGQIESSLGSHGGTF